MARALTSNFRELVTPGLRKVYFDTLMGFPQEARQLFNFIGPNAGGQAGKKFLEELQVASLGTFAEKPEGSPIQYDVPVEGNTVRAEPFTFGLGFRITMEMQQDELYGVMAKMPAQLGYAAAHQIESQAFRILNNGFSTSGGTGHTAAGFDSLALFSTSHVRLRGGTRANRASVDMDLSHTALEQAIDIFEGWTDHSGLPKPQRPRVLVVPYQLKWIAKEILQSELKPYTANNEINAVADEGISYFSCHYLTDPDSWYLLSAKGMHNLNVWMRMEPDFSTGDDFDTGDMKAKGVFRIATWHGEPDGTFGSQGA